MKKFIENFKLVLLSLFISLYICEIIILLFEKNFNNRDQIIAYKNHSSRAERAKKLNLYFDNRTPLEFYSDNKDYVPSMHPSQHLKFELINKIEIFPLSGLSNKKTFNCNESGKYNYFFSDKFGFNNYEERHKDNINTILLGDSFGMGDCVKFDQGIAEILNESNIETLNLSYGGNGPLLQYATLIEYGFSLKPKNLIWLYFDNDLEDLSFELQSNHLTSYLKQNISYDLKSRENEKEQFLINRLYSYINNDTEVASSRLINQNKKKKYINLDNWFIKTLLFYRLSSFINDRFFYKLLKNTECYNAHLITCENLINSFEEILHKAKNHTEKNGGKFKFILLPVYDRFFTYKNQNRILNKGKVLKILDNLNIEYIDMFEILKKKNPNELFPMSMSGHYNAYGYKLIADEIIKSVNK